MPDVEALTTRPLSEQSLAADLNTVNLVPLGAFGSENFNLVPVRRGLTVALAKYRAAIGVTAPMDSEVTLLLDDSGSERLTETSTGVLLTAQTLPPPEPLYREV